MAFLAVASIVLSVAAIGMMIWQIETRSRRLRQPLFWLSLLLNLVLIGAVALVYYRGINMPRSERSNENFVPPSMPEPP
jgi:predicted membrane protein